MKKQFLFGAIALSTLGLSYAMTAEKAQAFKLEGCSVADTNPALAASACQYITPTPVDNKSTNIYNDEAIDVSNYSPVNGKKVNVNNVFWDAADESAGLAAGSDKGFFGITDWTLIGKENDGKGESGATETTNITTDIDEGSQVDWSAYNTVMAIFKSGNGTTLVGYLLDNKVTDISWTNPWSNIQELNRGVSHISFYGTNVEGGCEEECEPPKEVPTPAAVLPILGGLFGAASRRKGGESDQV